MSEPAQPLDTDSVYINPHQALLAKLLAPSQVQRYIDLRPYDNQSVSMTHKLRCICVYFRHLVCALSAASVGGSTQCQSLPSLRVLLMLGARRADKLCAISMHRHRAACVHCDIYRLNVVLSACVSFFKKCKKIV